MVCTWSRQKASFPTSRWQRASFLICSTLVYSRCRLALHRGCLMYNGFTVEKDGQRGPTWSCQLYSLFSLAVGYIRWPFVFFSSFFSLAINPSRIFFKNILIICSLGTLKLISCKWKKKWSKGVPPWKSRVRRKVESLKSNVTMENKN